ncbi:MAG: four helix bundle protein [Chthoniobacterales bacterium]|nr:MAG: four helix bundle protein [Chthoniobacterales bacterium]
MTPERGDRKPERHTPPSADFRQRTFQFGIRCVRLVESLPKSMSAQTIGKQLLRAAPSVGANYRAAIRGRSRADFVSRMGIVEEECDEALYWIDVLVELGIISPKRVEELRREADEIIAITVSSIKTARKTAQK